MPAAVEGGVLFLIDIEPIGKSIAIEENHDVKQTFDIRKKMCQV